MEQNEEKPPNVETDIRGRELYLSYVYGRKLNRQELMFLWRFLRRRLRNYRKMGLASPAEQISFERISKVLGVPSQ